METLSLEMFKNSLGQSCALGWPCWSREVAADEHCGPVQPEPFCDAVKKRADEDKRQRMSEMYPRAARQEQCH